ncbi:MAG: ABC transporter ATP-binding protein [Lachnospiraceae bacterium]|nr:ABC transporter ATP-binding protein [Lachnospiraceae bacterium]MBD5502719.1 ABC transporter ATP-binding protein [Lachnospiraceae bacterium]
MSENIILDVRHMQKGYKKFPVLKDVSFQIKQGHILGLIGKNGAGKTTLMKSILGLNTNYQGEIIFHGAKMTASNETMKSEIGSLVDVNFYDDMTAYRNLKVAMMLTKAIHGSEQDERIRELLSFVGLETSANKSVRSFSFGMKQRLALAQALITKPVLLILDEPFVGLDPIGIEEVKSLLRQLCRENETSIIFSSHQLTEVCDLADDIVVLSDGMIKYSDTYENMKNSNISMVELMR